jgi:hypothetical protein
MKTQFLSSESESLAIERARKVQAALPRNGLLAGYQWRIAPEPFQLDRELVEELESLGRVLLQFYRAANLLYRQSLSGAQPAWVAQWLDQGKPAALLEWQRASSFKNALPRVIRPDLLLTDAGLTLTELDSVPGGIGLTAWLNEIYAGVAGPGWQVIGGSEGMKQGFSGIFGHAPVVHIVVSEESSSYRPEMEWLANQLEPDRFKVRDTQFTDFKPGEAVYRFFELFDLPNIASGQRIIELARDQQIQLTAPPKPALEEKMLLALLWNRNLQSYWHRHLGEGFFRRLRQIIPYTWVVDPAPLPPHAALPELNLADWRELKLLSQKERQLILKISGYSPLAWGARGVHLGNDLSQAAWSAAVDLAITSFPQSPYVLQRYHKPSLFSVRYFDADQQRLVALQGRVRLCPYYFLTGEGDHARAKLGGVLATICPGDKKIIHGMSDAVLTAAAGSCRMPTNDIDSIK